MPPKSLLVPGLNKRRKAARADSSDEDSGWLQARTSTLTKDRKRQKTSIPDGVARVQAESSQQSYAGVIPHEPRPEVVSAPALPIKHRRYKTSVSFGLQSLVASANDD